MKRGTTCAPPPLSQTQPCPPGLLPGSAGRQVWIQQPFSHPVPYTPQDEWEAAALPLPREGPEVLCTARTGPTPPGPCCAKGPSHGASRGQPQPPSSCLSRPPVIYPTPSVPCRPASLLAPRPLPSWTAGTSAPFFMPPPASCSSLRPPEGARVQVDRVRGPLASRGVWPAGPGKALLDMRLSLPPSHPLGQRGSIGPIPPARGPQSCSRARGPSRRLSFRPALWVPEEAGGAIQAPSSRPRIPPGAPAQPPPLLLPTSTASACALCWVQGDPGRACWGARWRPGSGRGPGASLPP